MGAPIQEHRFSESPPVRKHMGLFSKGTNSATCMRIICLGIGLSQYRAPKDGWFPCGFS